MICLVGLILLPRYIVLAAVVNEIYHNDVSERLRKDMSILSEKVHYVKLKVIKT